MSAQSQVAATLGQVARRLQGGDGDGGGGGEDRPLEGDLPDDGCILALADVATTRLYVVVEAVDGTLYLELSNTLTDEEFKRDAVRDEARLVFRRQVRVPPSLRARPPSRAASRSPAFRNNPTRRVERASRDGSPLASRRDSVASRAPDDASEPPRASLALHRGRPPGRRPRPARSHSWIMYWSLDLDGRPPRVVSRDLIRLSLTSSFPLAPARPLRAAPSLRASSSASCTRGRAVSSRRASAARRSSSFTRRTSA